MNFSTFYKCPHNTLTCKKTGVCISLMNVCDGETDCPDGEDEKNCTLNYFRCFTGELISIQLVCNFQDDCKDRSDEINCGKSCLNTILKNIINLLILFHFLSKKWLFKRVKNYSKRSF